MHCQQVYLQIKWVMTEDKTTGLLCQIVGNGLWCSFGHQLFRSDLFLPNSSHETTHCMRHLVVLTFLQQRVDVPQLPSHVLQLLQVCTPSASCSAHPPGQPSGPDRKRTPDSIIPQKLWPHPVFLQTTSCTHGLWEGSSAFNYNDETARQWLLIL